MNIGKNADPNIIPPSGIYRKLVPLELPKYKKPIFDRTKKLYASDYDKPDYFYYYTYLNDNIVTKYNTDGSVVIKSPK